MLCRPKGPYADLATFCRRVSTLGQSPTDIDLDDDGDDVEVAAASLGSTPLPSAGKKLFAYDDNNDHDNFFIFNYNSHNDDGEEGRDRR